jgi:hypothetical protein
MEKIPPIKPVDFKQQEGISLKMTAKGYYYWEINASGQLNQELISKLKEIDLILKQEFPRNVTMIPFEIGVTSG